MFLTIAKQHFNNRLLAGSVLFVFTALTTASIAAADVNTVSRVTTVNESGHTLNILVIRPHGDAIGGNLLRKPIVFGDLISNFVHHPNRCNFFEVSAMDTDAQWYARSDVEICRDRHNVIVLGMHDRVNQSPFLVLTEVLPRRLLITNATAFVMLYLFVAPAVSTMWGVDFLDDVSRLLPGQTLAIEMFGLRDEVQLELLTVDADWDLYHRTIEFCPNCELMELEMSMADLRIRKR